MEMESVFRTTVIDFTDETIEPPVTSLTVRTYGYNNTVHLVFGDEKFYELDGDVWDILRQLTPKSSSGTDALINEYAAKMQAVYYSGGADDHTFTGLMSEFARKLLGKD